MRAQMAMIATRTMNWRSCMTDLSTGPGRVSVQLTAGIVSRRELLVPAIEVRISVSAWTFRRL